MEFRAYHSGSKGNLYSITSDDGEVLLIDPGVSIKKIREALDYDMSNVVGALVSHSHLDHCKGVNDLLRLGVNCYMTQDTARSVPWWMTHHRICLFVPNSEWPLDETRTFTVRPFHTDHDCPGSVGFYLASGKDRLLYLTDAPFAVPRFAGLTHVCIEANWSHETMSDDLHPAAAKRIMRSHMSLDSALALLGANDLSKVREIWLLHLSDGNSNAEMFKASVERATGKPVMLA